MRRRNFLQTAGALLPAMIFASPTVFAASAATATGLVLINGQENDIADMVREAAEGAQLINAADVTDIRYSSSGFYITTTGGKTYTSTKVIMNTPYKVDTELLSVEVSADEQKHSLRYNSAANKKVVRPEMWAFTTPKLQSQDFKPFLKRKAHGFMCIS